LDRSYLILLLQRAQPTITHDPYLGLPFPAHVSWHIKRKTAPSTLVGDSWHGKQGLGHVLLLLVALRNVVCRIQGGIDAYVQCNSLSRASLFYIALGFQQLSFPKDVDAGKSRLPASLCQMIFNKDQQPDHVHWYSGKGCEHMCLYFLTWGTLNPPRLTRGDEMALFGKTIEACTSFGFKEQMYACFPLLWKY
jgi:hypothetical protein